MYNGALSAFNEGRFLSKVSPSEFRSRDDFVENPVLTSRCRAGR